MKKVEKLIDNRIAQSGHNMEAEIIDVEEDDDTKKVQPEIIPDDE